MVVEIGSKINAEVIFEYLFDKVTMASQKIGWKQVLSLEDIPKSYKEGSLFISQRNTFYEN